MTAKSKPGAPIMTVALPASVAPSVRIADVMAAEWAREVLMTIGDTMPRSMQTAVGASEIGQRCRRRLAYRIAGTTPVAIGDPCKSLMGIGAHEVLATGLTKLDPRRYLVEQAVSYRGVPGKLDAYDMWRRRLVDWKTTSVERLARYRNDGPPSNYVVQLNIYAAGLAALGYPVDLACLIFIPRNGELSDVWAWTMPPDVSIADQAIDTYLKLRADMDAGQTPGDVEAWPSVLCGWCPHHLPRTADLAVACPGKEGQ